MKKAFVLLPFLFFLGGCTATYPVVGNFEGHNELYKGTVNHNLLNGTAFIEIEAIVSHTKGRGNSVVTYVPFSLVGCKGQRGEAVITFDDGRVVHGTWLIPSDSCTKGAGEGVDQFGNTFKFTFGMSEKEAEKYIQITQKAISNLPEAPPVYKPKETRKEKGFSSGTGFFVTTDGYIVTSYHVIEDAKEILIKNSQGNEYVAKYIKGDIANDIAVLKVDIESKPISVATYANVSKGNEIFTLGYPLIQIQGQEQKASFGRVNALSGIQDDIRFLQIDVPTQPGNSGGPIIDKSGKVVGIANATLNQINVLRESGSLPQNVNYAIKSDYIFPLIREYLKNLNDGTVGASEVVDLAELIKKIEPSVVLIIAK
jgi:S1-C subfamily serine protease